jgi:hypothetical protein
VLRSEARAKADGVPQRPFRPKTGWPTTKRQRGGGRFGMWLCESHEMLHDPFSRGYFKHERIEGPDLYSRFVSTLFVRPLKLSLKTQFIQKA